MEYGESGLILAVSDIHLGYSRSNKQEFIKFLDEVVGRMGKSDRLVLLGDIFDFWRRKNISVVLENEDVLQRIEDSSAELYYIPGNHDLTFAKPDLFGKLPIRIQRNLTLEDAGRSFNFIHGYQLEVLANLEPLTVEEYEELCISICQRTGDFFGDLLSILWDTFQLSFKRGDRRKDMISSIGETPESRKDMHMVDRLARSRASHMFLGLRKGDTLIFGHTHRPFLDEYVANTGSWVSDSTTQNTYVTIENGEMTLRNFKSV